MTTHYTYNPGKARDSVCRYSSGSHKEEESKQRSSVDGGEDDGVDGGYPTLCFI